MAEADVDEDDWMWAWLIDRLGLCLWYGKERKTVYMYNEILSVSKDGVMPECKGAARRFDLG